MPKSATFQQDNGTTTLTYTYTYTTATMQTWVEALAKKVWERFGASGVDFGSATNQQKVDATLNWHFANAKDLAKKQITKDAVFDPNAQSDIDDIDGMT